jgi:hypothetical protein
MKTKLFLLFALIFLLATIPYAKPVGLVTDWNSERQYVIDVCDENIFEFRLQNTEDTETIVKISIVSDRDIARIDQSEFILPPHTTTRFKIIYAFPSNFDYNNGDYAVIVFRVNTVEADTGSSTGATIKTGMSSSFMVILGEENQEPLRRITTLTESETPTETPSGGSGGIVISKGTYEEPICCNETVNETINTTPVTEPLDIKVIINQTNNTVNLSINMTEEPIEPIPNSQNFVVSMLIGVVVLIFASVFLFFYFKG